MTRGHWGPPTVHYTPCILPPRNLTRAAATHRRDVRQCTGHIRAMSNNKGDEPTPIGEFRIQPSEIEPAFQCHWQEPQHNPPSLGESLPGYHVAVVLKNRQQDLVAWLQKNAERMSQQVDRGRRALGENDLLVRVSMQEAGDLRPRLIVGIGSRPRARVHPLMYVGARFHFETTQCMQDGFRHLCCRGIVQIVEPRVSKGRKFSLECGGIKRSFRSTLHGVRLPTTAP
jgi:hypothetical protein